MCILQVFICAHLTPALTKITMFWISLNLKYDIVRVCSQRVKAKEILEVKGLKRYTFMLGL